MCGGCSVSPAGALRPLDGVSTPTGIADPVTPGSGAVSRASSPATVERTAEALAIAFGDEQRRAAALCLPVGPIDVEDRWALKREVNLVGAAAASTGGAWTVRISKPRAYANRGEVVEFCCIEKDKVGCPFKLFYERAQTGYMIYNFVSGHTGHTLATSAPQRMVRGSGRHIPASFSDLGFLLAESGFSAKDIHRVFVTKCKRDNIGAPTFKYEDV